VLYFRQFLDIENEYIKEKEEDVSSYWMILRKRNWKLKEGALKPHYVEDLVCKKLKKCGETK
jgi:hypothetical protein